VDDAEERAQPAAYVALHEHDFEPCPKRPSIPAETGHTGGRG